MTPSNGSAAWGLVLIALLILAQFMIDYNHAQQQLNTVAATK